MKSPARNSLLHRAFRSRRAFTLIELLISMIIMSMIVLGVGSSIVIALRAAEANRNPNTVTNEAVSAQGAVEQMQADLKVATAVTNSSASGCTLTVPDRNGDGNAEQIIYSWAGAGSPVMRQYNTQPAISIADNVQNFNLTWFGRTIGKAVTLTQGSEQVLASQSSILYSSTALSTTSWAAEWFAPSLPANAVYWTITKVSISFHGNSTSTLTARIQPVDAADLPLASVTAFATASASTIPKSGDATITFPLSMGNLSPNQAYAIIVTSSSTGTGVNHATVSLSSNMGWTTSTTSGSSWTAPSSLTAMQFTVYGKVTTQ